MNRKLSMIGSFGLGAGVAYLFDPDLGNRRRALLRDKITQKINDTADALEQTARDLQNRIKGMVSEIESRLQNEEVSDEALTDRVRAKIGMVSVHPGVIEVRVENGRVILTGPILEAEVGPLIAAVALVRGVADVENQMEVHSTADNVPALQGGRRRSLQFEFTQTDGSSTERLLMGAAGLLLTLYGIRRDGLFRTALGTAGIGMLTRSVANKPVKELVGAGLGYRAVNIHKTITIAAPVEKVFAFWDNFENFPTFMSNVRQVQIQDDGKSHWVVSGPAGVPVEWDAVITKREPNRLIAWKTVPGSTVAHSGEIRFEPTPDGGTRVEIEMSYTPPAGVLGHAVASLFGADPKSKMDEDLNRMKTLIETGQRPQGAAAA